MSFEGQLGDSIGCRAMILTLGPSSLRASRNTAVAVSSGFRVDGGEQASQDCQHARYTPWRQLRDAGGGEFDLETRADHGVTERSCRLRKHGVIAVVEGSKKVDPADDGDAAAKEGNHISYADSLGTDGVCSRGEGGRTGQCGGESESIDERVRCASGHHALQYDCPQAVPNGNILGLRHAIAKIIKHPETRDSRILVDRKVVAPSEGVA